MPDLRFRPMAREEFESFLDSVAADYAAQLVRAGQVSEADAMQSAWSSIEEVIPGRKYHEDLHILVAENGDGAAAGHIWYGFLQNGVAYVYDLAVAPAYRRMGYGRRLMQAFEQRAVQAGSPGAALHVFAHNEGALHLYG